MNEDLTSRKTERKFDLFGQTKAKNIALADIREYADFGSRYTLMLTYSVKEQLKCFNDISLCSIDDLADDIKIIPISPRKERKNKEYFSVYENRCLFDDNVEHSTYFFYIIEIKEAEGRISKELFSFIKDTGIKIRTMRNGIEFNPIIDFVENANFCSSIDDFVLLEDVPYKIKEKYDSHILEQYQAMLNIIDAKINKKKYGRYDFRENKVNLNLSIKDFIKTLKPQQ
jgi:hypothetical protein